ncbi:MAG: hypothetical protein IJC18_05080, partial [Clostridia bacterium]|nr:hypothetical protein [Clostridia bacterium]
MDKFKVGVVGAATPVGAELIKLLSRHPIVELTAISSLAHQGKPICEVFPALLGLCDKILVSDTEVLIKSDIVFCCDTAMSTHDLAARCIKAKCVFIDLGATFRIDGEDNYREWIGGEYEYPELHEAAVYGLPELLRDRLPGKVIAAIPGAVATGAILALAPALFGGLVLPDSIVVDALCPGSCGDIISDAALPHPETFETERMLTLAAGKTVRLAI